jgi:O-methyltransferase involved in polyketide biosynthesis
MTTPTRGGLASNGSSDSLSGVAETLLLPLYHRAMESLRPDAMIKDENAVRLVAQNSLDFSRVRQIRMNELLKVMRIMFTREFDHCARDFLRRHSNAVVVRIGCGLDTRYERVGCYQHGDDQVVWFDLDLPEVIELRGKLLGDEGEHYHLLASSVLEDAWLEAVEPHQGSAFLFLAETVFVYFTKAQVKSLVLRLREHFPGSELVFDGWRPFEVWLGNRYLSNLPFVGLMRWGLWNGQEIEGWGGPSTTLRANPSTTLRANLSTTLRAGRIRLLDEWGFFDQPAPRLDPYRWMAPFFRLFKPMRIFHFQLGEAAG